MYSRVKILSLRTLNSELGFGSATVHQTCTCMRDFKKESTHKHINKLGNTTVVKYSESKEKEPYNVRANATEKRIRNVNKLNMCKSP